MCENWKPWQVCVVPVWSIHTTILAGERKVNTCQNVQIEMEIEIEICTRLTHTHTQPTIALIKRKVEITKKNKNSFTIWFSVSLTICAKSLSATQLSVHSFTYEWIAGKNKTNSEIETFHFAKKIMCEKRCRDGEEERQGDQAVTGALLSSSPSPPSSSIVIWNGRMVSTFHRRLFSTHTLFQFIVVFNVVVDGCIPFFVSSCVQTHND